MRTTISHLSQNNKTEQKPNKQIWNRWKTIVLIPQNIMPYRNEIITNGEKYLSSQSNCEKIYLYRFVVTMVAEDSKHKYLIRNLFSSSGDMCVIEWD